MRHCVQPGVSGSCLWRYAPSAVVFATAESSRGGPEAAMLKSSSNEAGRTALPKTPRRSRVTNGYSWLTERGYCGVTSLHRRMTQE